MVLSAPLQCPCVCHHNFCSKVQCVFCRDTGDSCWGRSQHAFLSFLTSLSSCPWPQEWAVTPNVPSGLHKYHFFVYAHNLKWEQFRVKTLVWIGANMTSEKAKEQCVAVVQCVSIEEEMIQMRQCRGKCVFLSSRSIRKCMFLKADVLQQLMRRLIKRVKSDALFSTMHRLNWSLTLF